MGTETSQVTALIEPILIELGYELVELQLRNEQFGLVLRVIIHKDPTVSLEDCRLVSREINHILEIEDPITTAYNLEVTSPGLDRPLKTFQDFSRNLEKKVHIRFDEGDGDLEVSGIIKRTTPDSVELFLEGTTKAILLESIKKAVLVIEF